MQLPGAVLAVLYRILAGEGRCILPLAWSVEPPHNQADSVLLPLRGESFVSRECMRHVESFTGEIDEPPENGKEYHGIGAEGSGESCAGQGQPVRAFVCRSCGYLWWIAKEGAYSKRRKTRQSECASR
jgi:hypothetical protein